MVFGEWHGYAWTGTEAGGQYGSTISPEDFSEISAGDPLCAGGTVPAAHRQRRGRLLEAPSVAGLRVDNWGTPPASFIVDLHLVAGSPCEDNGLESLGVTADANLDGNPRVVGDGIDMGCFEIQ